MLLEKKANSTIYPFLHNNFDKKIPYLHHRQKSGGTKPSEV